MQVKDFNIEVECPYCSFTNELKVPGVKHEELYRCTDCKEGFALSVDMEISVKIGAVSWNDGISESIIETKKNPKK